MDQENLFCFQAYPSIVGEYGRMEASCGYLGGSLTVWNTEERYIVLMNRLTQRNSDPNNTRLAIADIRILIEYETKSSTLIGSSVHNRDVTNMCISQHRKFTLRNKNAIQIQVNSYHITVDN